MSAALAVTPASGSINAKKDFVRIDVTGADPTIRHRVKAECSGQATLVSHEFQPSSDGNHTWFNVMFPADGSWTLTLYNTANDATVITAAVTVV
jgi:hypothetical protein